jgi:hypothetical protein
VEVVLERAVCDGCNLAQVTGREAFESIAEVHRPIYDQPEFLQRESEAFERYWDAQAPEGAEEQD